MALTLTEDFRMTAGGKQWRFMSVTDDETTSSFTAASIDMNVIEYAGNLGLIIASDAVDTSILTQHMLASIGTDGLTVRIGVPAKDGSIKKLLLIGW
jgi:hypothetical protein